jgi:hypothetical protein
VIDRAEDGDGDAFHPALDGPDASDGSSADSPVTHDAPDKAARSDGVLASSEQRAAASRRYQDTVDHTYDVARVEADEPDGSDARDSEAEPPEAPDAEAPEAEVPEAEGADGTDRADGAGAEARDAWAEALPELRAAWEKHEQTYPERTRPAPRSQADGGWLADGGRRLSPEQNAEASKACEDIRAEGREVILPAMERVEAADPDRRLAGLEHMLKGEDRLKEKIADEMTAKPGLSIGNAVDTVVDPVRFTFTYSPQRYAEGTLSDVERLKSEGFELVKLKNLWTDDQYKGINSQWRRPETGLRFEVQFHTPESLEAKELTHKAYERIRSTASPAERQVLKVYQRQVNATLDTPPGTAEIKDLPEKR